MRLRNISAPVLMLFYALFGGCSSEPSSSSSGSSGGGTTATALTVTSVSPANITAGTTTVTLIVTGTGFTSSSSVQVGGVAETTTFFEATRITASVPASQLTSGALLPVFVVNGTSTTGSGAAVDLEIDNPAPAISSFAPSSFITGAAASTVTVSGTASFLLRFFRSTVPTE